MLLIIFGAGASYDHGSNNYPIDFPGLPLTDSLINNSSSYAKNAMVNWPGAVGLLHRLIEEKRIQKDTFNLERALFTHSERKNQYIQEQLLAFKFYIHEVLRKSEDQVRSRTQAYTNYTKLLSAMQDENIDSEFGVRLVTFNYDTLLEAACHQVYPSWDFYWFPDYIEGNPLVKLYKPHGSLSWRRLYESARLIAGTDAIKVFSNPGRYELRGRKDMIVDYSMEFPNIVGPGHTVQFSEPMVALPYQTKTTFVFPEEHKKALIQDVRSVTHILTIGWRGTELHFLDEILPKVLLDQKLRIYNVNMGGATLESNLRRTLGRRIERIDSFAHGFSKFMEHVREGELSVFLRHARPQF